MGNDDTLPCPASGCSFEGTVSRVVHHVTGEEDTDHSWDALGFRNSWQFRRAHASVSDSDPGDAASAGSDPDGTPSREPETSPLERVPGIGSTRATALRDAGYGGAADVARASIGELRRVRNVSETAARCIRATARAESGHEDAFVGQLSDALDVDRNELAEAYGDLASALVPPEEAERTLELLFDSDSDRSVVRLTDYSLRYRHFLIRAGFDRVEDVARASVDELTEARYVGESLARNLRESAREGLDARPAERGDGVKADTAGGTDRRDDSGDEGGLFGGKVDHGSPSSVGDAVGSERFPPEMVDRDQWLLWKQTDDGRKIPRAPWETGDALRYVSAMDPANWTSFREATRWRSKLPHDLHLAYAITRDDPVLFVDLDDVVTDGELSRAARALIGEIDSYAAVSTSGRGVHVFARGGLSDGVKSLTGPIDDSGDQTLEVYDRNRFVATTGNHLDGTPPELTSADSVLGRLEDEFASVSSETPDRATAEPRRSRDELHELETTSEIQDVFDAINQTRPSDISMRSTRTREHGDGTYSYDPSWVHSESGTRLGVLEDVWIYRKGMIALNALQLVALEERIITDEREYPEGDAFWEAVDALRDRGAHVPSFEPESEPVDETAFEDTGDGIDSREVAKRINYGDRVRMHVHPYDRDYQERLALELTPVLVEAAESLRLSPPVTYRAAELYASGHAAGIVPGAAHESSLGAALRTASIEAGTPRPLADVADTVGESPKSVRRKFHRLVKETPVAETLDASDLVVEPSGYVPYMARRLGRGDDEQLRDSVRELLDETELDGGSNPMSEVAAAFYVAMKRSSEESVTQREIADAAGLSVVTIRNNYRKFS